MKLSTVISYLKKIQKIYELRDTPLEFCWHQHFFTGNQQILLYQEIQIKIAFWYMISNSFKFYWVFKDSFNNQGYNFDDVSKNGYPKTKVLWKKVTNKTLWSDSNYIVDVAIWTKFGNSSISVKEFVITSRIWPEKLLFLRSGLGSRWIIWDWH